MTVRLSVRSQMKDLKLHMNGQVPVCVASEWNVAYIKFEMGTVLK